MVAVTEVRFHTRRTLHTVLVTTSLLTEGEFPAEQLENELLKLLLRPGKSMPHGKRRVVVSKMPDITKHSASRRSIWLHHQVSKRAVENGHSKPCFRWQLQRSAEKIPDHISMTNNYLKLMMVYFLLASSGRLLWNNFSVYVFLEC